MFTRLKIDQNISVGTVVYFNTTNSSWMQAEDLSTLIGIVKTTPTQAEGDDFYTAEIQFAGHAYALASRDIPSEGGMLTVENGGVYATTPQNQSCGIIAPLPYNDTSSRATGSLVLVELR